MTKSAAKSAGIAILGALAYDRIATTKRPFGASGPGLNSKVSASSEHFGGCGGNIVYHLAQLQQPALLLSVSGNDDQPYRAQLAAHRADLSGVYRDSHAPCANAFILSDPNGRQFTAFQPGPQIDVATWREHLEGLQTKLSRCPLLLCAPFPPELMRATMAFTCEYAPQALVIWCPGQYTDQMSAADLQQCSDYWHWLLVNEHERDYISAHAPDIMQQKTIVTTRGSAAISVETADGIRSTFAVQPATTVADPTGCGDAFAAGLASALVHDAAQPLTRLDQAIAQGMQCAKICLSHQGGQPTPLNRSVYGHISALQDT